MPNSPINTQITNTQKRLCDFCGEKSALVYCRADSAKLCLSCDREVHCTNQLFTKHIRFQLCDSCDSSPASIFCCTEQSVFCQNCDYEVHNLPKCMDNHDRRPLEGFTGRPSAVEMAAIIGFEGFDCKNILVDEKGDDDHDHDNFGDLLGGFEEGEDGFCDYFVWDTPAVVNLDDLIVSTDKTHNFHAMVVPPLPKDRNLSCGQHKQEMLRQLCELAKLEPDIKQGSNPFINHHLEADENQDFRVQDQVQAYKRDEEHPIFLGSEARECSRDNDGFEAVNDDFQSPWLSEINVEECALFSDAKSGICSSVSHTTTGWNSQTVGTESTSVPPKVPSHEFTAADRVSAVTRYKEKKRTRRFEKHIRYESRKLQAENRTRVKGRFAKMDNRAV
ncbi:zinc finger protein CONSTANS-LIKE 13 [Silene latifolia]|uniref:zinc finger protein CONSTANS-LIKE 13 n=1 Tax=Silene latifolia TaxID=37657 RepID=UPI003D76FAD3